MHLNRMRRMRNSTILVTWNLMRTILRTMTTSATVIDMGIGASANIQTYIFGTAVAKPVTLEDV